MRSFQFWILVLGSVLVSLLMMKNVFLARAFNQEQRLLVESEQMASAAPQYENAWKTLAMHIYQQGKSDPGLQAVLKNADVQVRSEATPSPETGTAPALAPTATPVPTTPVKTLATP